MGLVHPRRPPFRRAGDGGPPAVALAPGSLWRGAYRRPREFNWWFGMALLFLTLGFSLTGYLLPWDQKGYWATRSRPTSWGGAGGRALLAEGPGRRDRLRQPDGHPVFRPARRGACRLLFVLCLAAHIALFRRHGMTPPAECRASGRPATFWPEQLFMDTRCQRGVVRRRDLPGSDRGWRQPRRSGRPLELRLPGTSRVVLPLALPDAQALPGQPRDHRHDRDPDVARPGHAAPPVSGPALARANSPISWRAASSSRSWGCRLSHGPGPERRCARCRRSRQPGKRRTPSPASPLSWLAVPDVGIPPDGSAYVLPPRSAHPGPERPGKNVPELPLLRGKGSGKQTASDLSPFRLRERGFAACWQNPTSPTYFGKVAPSATAWPNGRRAQARARRSSTTSPISSPSFATIPDDMTPDEWLNSPGTFRSIRVSTPLQEGVREVPRHRWIHRRRQCATPQLFAWGSTRWIARMIRKPGQDNYGYLEPSESDARLRARPASATTSTMVIRYLKDDYPGQPGRRSRSRGNRSDSACDARETDES